MDEEKEEPETEFNERRRDAGTSFLAFIKKNYLKGQTPKIDFIPRSLKYMLSKYNFSEKALLLFVLKPESPSIEQIIRSIVMDTELSNMVNECFFPMGILTTSSEMKLVQSFAASKSFPDRKSVV